MSRKDPTNIRMTEHVVIRVRNVFSMIDFYCDALSEFVLGYLLERGPGENDLEQLQAGESFIDKVREDEVVKNTNGKYFELEW